MVGIGGKTRLGGVIVFLEVDPFRVYDELTLPSISWVLPFTLGLFWVLPVVGVAMAPSFSQTSSNKSKTSILVAKVGREVLNVWEVEDPTVTRGELPCLGEETEDRPWKIIFQWCGRSYNDHRKRRESYSSFPIEFVPNPHWSCEARLFQQEGHFENSPIIEGHFLGNH